MNFTYFKNDIKHYAIIFPITLFVFLFYVKYGFYGWTHLLSVIFIQYAGLPIDDWLDEGRPFPFYVLPMIAFATYFFPLITVLAITGGFLVNLRVLTHKNNFFLERIECLGDVLIYVLPFTLPIGLTNWQMYVAAILYIVFVDSFHKIGHKETSHSKLMWITGLISLTFVSLLFGALNIIFLSLLLTTLLSLLPFVFVKDRLYGWIYTQVWMCSAGLVGFGYYLFFSTRV